MLLTAYLILYSFVALFGVCIGSFLNVVIYRCPRHESLVKGASHCTTCGKPLKKVDMIPIVSWLFLRGRCRFCGQRISPRYPLIEGWDMGLWLLCFAVFGFTWMALVVSLAMSTLLVIAMVDWDTQEIMDSTVIVLALLGIAAFFADPSVLWWERLLGAVVISVPMLLLALLTGGLGGGDVKLMAAAGLLLGWQSTLLAALIGAVSGAVYAVIQMKRGKLTKKSEMAFGPWLVMGIMTALLFGSRIIPWYLALLR